MEKTTLLSLLVTLFLIQWHRIAAEQKDTVEAKLTSAMNKDEDKYLVLVKDEKAKSGWAVDVKRALGKLGVEHTYLEFYTKPDPKAKFNRTSVGSLYTLLSLNDQKVKFLPAQIAGMIFPTTAGKLKVQKLAILGIAQVNYLALKYEIDFQKDEAFFPKTTPYEMEVRIKNVEQFFEQTGEYIFKVNFNIGGDMNKK